MSAGFSTIAGGVWEGSAAGKRGALSAFVDFTSSLLCSSMWGALPNGGFGHENLWRFWVLKTFGVFFFENPYMYFALRMSG